MLTWPALRLASSLLAISYIAANVSKNPRESRLRIYLTITSSLSLISFFWLGLQSRYKGLPAHRLTRVVRGILYIAAAHRTLSN